MCLLNRLVTIIPLCFCLVKEGLTDRQKRREGITNTSPCMSGEGGTDWQHEEKGCQSNWRRDREKLRGKRERKTAEGKIGDKDGKASEGERRW